MTAEPAARPTPKLKRERQLAQYQRALKTLPGGTNSNFRVWGEHTVYIDRGKGGRVWDQDGNEYIDLRLGYGPVILGHGDERVDDHVNERMRKGVSFSLTSEDEIRAMELLKELNPWVDKARMTVSGTEATMHAMRIARAYTGRTKIVKFEGQYHGVHDYALISVAPSNMADLGDGDNPVALAWGRGIPSEIAKTIIPARYNNIDFLRRLFERQGEEIAAIIVEPVLGNAAGILPEPGFHQAMRALTEEFGILLIFDEVKTGFRFARGGAAEYFGITPDLATYAKAMGNGYPAAAFGGSRRGDERPARSRQPRRHVRGQPRRGGRGRQDARDHPRHRRPGDDPRHRQPDPGGRAREDRGEGPAVPHHGSPLDVRHHVHRPRRDRVPRLGRHGPRAVRRGRHGDARPGGDAGAGQPGAVVRVRGARPGGHGGPGDHDLRPVAGRGARARAQGPRRGPAGAMSKTPPGDRRARGGEATDDPRRKRRPVGRPGRGPAAGPGRGPGRGRGDRARPAPRAAQVDGLAAARDAREAGPRGAGRRDRQVPARDHRAPPRGDRGADARPALDRDARAGPPRPRDARDDRPGRARRRPLPDGRPGRRAQPRRDGRLDRPVRAAALAWPRARC